jgi:hypothetical protein
MRPPSSPRPSRCPRLTPRPPILPSTPTAALEKLVLHRVTGLPVVDASQRVVGIVSQGDLVGAPGAGVVAGRPRRGRPGCAPPLCEQSAHARPARARRRPPTPLPQLALHTLGRTKDDRSLFPAAGETWQVRQGGEGGGRGDWRQRRAAAAAAPGSPKRHAAAAVAAAGPTAAARASLPPGPIRPPARASRCHQSLGSLVPPLPPLQAFNEVKKLLAKTSGKK